MRNLLLPLRVFCKFWFSGLTDHCRRKQQFFSKCWGLLNFFCLFLFLFILSHKILFFSTFRYIILSLFLLPFTSNLFFVFCFIYLFRFHFGSLSFRPIPSLSLYLSYIICFLNIIFLIEFCRPASDLKRCKNLSWRYLHYIL